MRPRTNAAPAIALAILTAAALAPTAHAQTLTKIADFTSVTGGGGSSLVVDSNGNLFGTTSAGGANTSGTVFEITKTGSTYGTVTTIATFDGTNGSKPLGPLSFDASGNLFGTTTGGGANSLGTVFELANTGSGYGPISTVASFSAFANGVSPAGRLTVDASGNLFGTTQSGGTSGGGAIFEIAKSGSSFGPIVTLGSLPSSISNSFAASSSLTVDSAGNLLGISASGGTNNNGFVFELPKTSQGYGAVATLAKFTGGNDGATPLNGLQADAAGNLFGTTSAGGTAGQGTVFEIPKTNSGYGTLITLASFLGSDGSSPNGDLLVDANGNLFGTTFHGGANGKGVVFELAETSAGYGPIAVLGSLDGHGTGNQPISGLAIDASGNLFGTSISDGCCKNGTAFEVTNSGFATSGGSPTPTPSPTPDPTAVPEPATAALLGAGLIALLAVSRRSGRPA